MGAGVPGEDIITRHQEVPVCAEFQLPVTINSWQLELIGQWTPALCCTSCCLVLIFLIYKFLCCLHIIHLPYNLASNFLFCIYLLYPSASPQNLGGGTQSVSGLKCHQCRVLTPPAKHLPFSAGADLAGSLVSLLLFVFTSCLYFTSVHVLLITCLGVYSQPRLAVQKLSEQS